MTSSEIWAIEVKYGSAHKLNKHFSQTCNDVAATHKYVVYGGTDEFTIGDNVTMISLKGMMNKLMQQQTYSKYE